MASLASGEAAEGARLRATEGGDSAPAGASAGPSQARGARGASVRAFVEGVPFHAGLIVAGALFLLVGAFHGNVWFDESYSVGIAGHSFVDIWQIGAGDVHPVLFYRQNQISVLSSGRASWYTACSRWQVPCCLACSA